MQAEHGPDGLAWLVTWSEAAADADQRGGRRARRPTRRAAPTSRRRSPPDGYVRARRRARAGDGGRQPHRARAPRAARAPIPRRSCRWCATPARCSAARGRRRRRRLRRRAVARAAHARLGPLRPARSPSPTSRSRARRHARRGRVRASSRPHVVALAEAEGLDAHADVDPVARPMRRVTADRAASGRVTTSRSMEGYHSPQVDVEVRLNTNESPEPPPAACRDALGRRAAPRRVAPLPRPRRDRAAGGDRRPARRRRRAGLRRQRLERGAADAAAHLRRRTAARSATFEPTYQLHSHIARITGTVGRRRRAHATTSRSTWTRCDRVLADARPDDHVPLLAEQPDRAWSRPRTRCAQVLDARARPARGRRGLRPVRAVVGARARRRGPCRSSSPARTRRRGRWRRPGSATSSARRGSCAELDKVVLPYHLDAAKQIAGRLALDFADEMEARVAARRRGARAARRPALRRPAARRVAVGRQLRARSGRATRDGARGVAGAARPLGARPQLRVVAAPRRLPARHGRHRRRGRRVPGRARRRCWRETAPRPASGATKETVDRRRRSTSTAPARTEVSTGLPFFDHMLDQLGRHGGFDLTVQATGDLARRQPPHGRGHRHHARRGVRARRSATRPACAASPAGCSRSTRRWSRWRSTCPAGRSSCGTSRSARCSRSAPAVRPRAGRALLAVVRDRGRHHAARHASARAQHAPHRRGDVQGRGPLPARRGARSRARPCRRRRARCDAVSGPLIAVLDYGIGNLRSAQKALERVGADARLTADQRLIGDADGVVLPGVGAFGRCMEALRTHRARASRRSTRSRSGRPFLGICIGMQLLYDALGGEPRRRRASACSPARCARLPDGVKRPQMQWNVLDVARRPPLFAGLARPGVGLLRPLVRADADDPRRGRRHLRLRRHGRRRGRARQRRRDAVPPGEVGRRRACTLLGELRRRGARRDARCDLYPSIDLRGGPGRAALPGRLRPRDRVRRRPGRRGAGRSPPRAPAGSTSSTSTPPAAASRSNRAVVGAIAAAVSAGAGAGRWRRAHDGGRVLADAGVARVVIGTAALEDPALVAPGRGAPAASPSGSTTGTARWRVRGWIRARAPGCSTCSHGSPMPASTRSSSPTSRVTARSPVPTSTGSRAVLDRDHASR